MVTIKHCITAVVFTLILFIMGCGGGLEGDYRPLNEDEQYIWDMIAECFEIHGYDTTNMQPVLIQYTESPCNNSGWAGCTWSNDGVSYVNIGVDYAYATTGQYPDFVWTDLNVELFIHEFLHRFGGELLGDPSHGSTAYTLCPQNLWNNPDNW